MCRRLAHSLPLAEVAASSGDQGGYVQRISILATLALFAGLFAYGQSQPSQPPDPTAQSPATQAPATPPTFPRTESKPDTQAPEARASKDSSETSAQAAKVFTGTITQDKDGYVLESGDQKYKLDDQSKAKAYDGKQVRVQGTLDRDRNKIRVDKIEEAPSM
jgi:Protein of unknown function (DUF5818)